MNALRCPCSKTTQEYLIDLVKTYNHAIDKTVNISENSAGVAYAKLEKKNRQYSFCVYLKDSRLDKKDSTFINPSIKTVGLIEFIRFIKDLSVIRSDHV